MTLKRLLVPLLLLAGAAFAQPPTTIRPGGPVASAVVNANFLGLYNGRVGRWSGMGAPGNFPFSLVGDLYYDTASPGSVYGCYQVHCTAVGTNNWVLVSSGGGGGGSAFNAITAGINTSATMTVGNGASITYTGTGIVSANRILGTTLTGLTGPIKMTAGIPSTMAYTDVTALWITSGTCNSSTVLFGDGHCAGTGGVGTVTSINGAGTGIFAFTGGPVTAAGTLTLTQAGTSGGIPYFSNATTLSSSAALAQNQIVLGGGAGAAPFSFASLGTTATLLHGNASGGPSWGSVVNADIAAATIDLTAKVTGILPGANGGTGNGFFAVTGPATALKTFTLPNASATILTSNSPVTVPQGGTGLTTGTSGGIPYFNTTTTIASSAALGAHGVVLGEGAGTAPITTATGSAGQVLTSNGASADPTFQAAGAGTVSVVGAGALTSTECVTGGGSQTIQTPSANCTVDSSGNLVANSLASGTSPPAVTGTGIIGLGESNGQACPASAADCLQADSATHRLLIKNNSNTSGGAVLGDATPDTLTNKTYDTAGTGNSFLINGVAVTANTGTGAVVRATSPTVTLTNATGLPVSTGISGLGTGVATALAANVSGTGAICLASGSACSGGGVSTQTSAFIPVGSQHFVSGSSGQATQVIYCHDFQLSVPTTVSQVSSYISAAVASHVYGWAIYDSSGNRLTAATSTGATTATAVTNAPVALGGGALTLTPSTSGRFALCLTSDAGTGFQLYGDTGDLTYYFQPTGSSAVGYTAANASSIAGSTITWPSTLSTKTAFATAYVWPAAAIFP